MLYILGLLLIGLLAGALARIVVSSPVKLGCLGTALLGILGSYAGGSLWAILFYDRFDLRRTSTFLGAVAGSILILAAWRLLDRGRGRRLGR
ncbi:MAG: GlsB/YeaQ/YmgE family stress response membrane protein [Actinomycetota bacterium]|nr:GlsB/YeaQ/YmgE family stress response membrane protein [Actinomycetota bacterium]